MPRINLWIILLLVSVLLNGVLLGGSARSWFGPERPAAMEMSEPRRGGFQLRAFVEALPEDQRREARARAEASRAELRGLVRETVMTRRAAAQALLADPYDPEAAAEALEQARQARAALERATEGRILEIADELDPDVRQAAFEAAMTLPPRRGPGRERRPPAQGG